MHTRQPRAHEACVHGLKESQTERGEALLSTDANEAWYAVWLRSNYEHAVNRQLSAKGFQPFLPEVRAWSRRAGARHAIVTAMQTRRRRRLGWSEAQVERDQAETA